MLRVSGLRLDASKLLKNTLQAHLMSLQLAHVRPFEEMSAIAVAQDLLVHDINSRSYRLGPSDTLIGRLGLSARCHDLEEILFVKSVYHFVRSSKSLFLHSFCFDWCVFEERRNRARLGLTSQQLVLRTRYAYILDYCDSHLSCSSSERQARLLVAICNCLLWRLTRSICDFGVKDQTLDVNR